MNSEKTTGTIQQAIDSLKGIDLIEMQKRGLFQAADTIFETIEKLESILADV